MTAGTDKEEAE